MGNRRNRIVPSRARVAGFAVIDASSGTPTLQRGKNVSSLTDVGVGLTTVNWVTEVPTAGPLITNGGGTSGSGNIGCLRGTTPPTVSAVYFETSTTTNVSVGFADLAWSCVLALRSY